MAEKLDDKELVSFKEALISQMIQLDAVTQLLLEKGIITGKEFVSRLKQVQNQCEAKRGDKG